MMSRYFSKDHIKKASLAPNERYYESKLLEDEYLTELSCNRIQSVLRENFFQRMDNASFKNYLPNLAFSISAIS